jgi:hypothetical protein
LSEIASVIATFKHPAQVKRKTYQEYEREQEIVEEQEHGRRSGKDGRVGGVMERWSDGRMEGWKDGRMGGVVTR